MESDRELGLQLAQNCLKSARKRDYRAEGYINEIKYYRQKYGLTLEEIGTSQQELNAIIPDSRKDSVLQILRLLRRGVEYPEGQLVALHLRLLDAGGLGLEDIGTNEEELAELVKKAA